MASAPRWKVYRHGEYVAACKYAEDAAAIVACSGDGAEIRDGHRYVVWAEGHESQPAGDSYDFVANEIARKLAKVAAQWGQR